MTADSRPELAHDVLGNAQRRPLDAMFSPRTVAVIGATEKEGSVGCAVSKNWCAFDGPVYPFNPKRTTVLAIQAFPSLAAVPEEVDLAVIATPAPTVPGIVRECAQDGKICFERATEFSLPLLLSKGGEGRGEEGLFINFPSLQLSPRSFLAGREARHRKRFRCRTQLADHPRHPFQYRARCARGRAHSANHIPP